MKHVLLIGAMLVLAAHAAPAAEPAADLTVDQAFGLLKAWDYDQPRKPLTLLERHIATTSADPAKKREVADRLVAVIADAQATEAARQWACQQVALVAGDAQVSALVKLLDEPKLADAARRALEGIPGEASLEALRALLPKAKGDLLVGVVNSLGQRRDAKSVAALAAVLGGADLRAAAAAAISLGKIGTAEAGEALGKTPKDEESRKKLSAAIADGVFRCAERQAALGNTANAESFYTLVAQESQPATYRMAAMAGLVRCGSAKALPLVLAALASDDAYVQGTAARLARDLPGAEATAGLVKAMGTLDAKGKVLVLGVLADRGDKSAAGAVAKLLDDKDDAVKTAAVAALGRLGDASSLSPLATLAAANNMGARNALARLTGADVDVKLVALAGEGDAAVRAEFLRAIGARRSPLASGTLLKAAADADDKVRAAALEALAAGGGPDAYDATIQLLSAARTPADLAATEKAVVAIGSRMEPSTNPAGHVTLLLTGASDAVKPAVLRILGNFGGPDALKALQPALGDANAAVADAAVRALAGWPDDSAAADLLKVAKDSPNATHRSLALRGYLRLAREAKESGARLKMLDAIRPMATTVDAKRMLLGGLSEVADPGALGLAIGFIDDKDVHAEAMAATLKVGQALAKTDRAAVQAAAKKLADAAKDKDVTDLAEALRKEAAKPQSTGGGTEMLAYDKARSEALKKDLAKRGPKGYRLACYLDCGPDVEDGTKGGPTLRVLGGQVHLWPGAENEGRFGTVAFGPQEIAFEVTGLAPKRAYQVGFTWWDYDHDTRAESVWMATAKGERETKVVDKTPLPSHVKGELPAEKTLAVPRELSATGAVRIAFRCETPPNAVVCELWLWESEAESDAPAAAAPAEKPSLPPPAAGKAEKHILVVTGIEYPGHPWRQTAPALAEIVAKDPRMDARVVEDATLLESLDLGKYDAIILNYMNWERSDAGPEAREGLRKFVDSGKGLVLVHFACGAFQGWPEFVKIVGRIWGPKARPHDPFGKFRVDITALDHPITKGLKPFDTEDELYTCLVGDTPIQVLATAKSKVDSKDYPMAFVVSYGKGRTFHCVLGHDAKCIQNPPVAELYRRGTAWAAGLTP